MYVKDSKGKSSGIIPVYCKRTGIISAGEEKWTDKFCSMG